MARPMQPTGASAEMRGKARLRPRDAASLILIDGSGRSARILMGRRSQSAVFLPGAYVFPGGRVERIDARTPIKGGLSVGDSQRLIMQVRGVCGPQRATGFAVAALRECYEEAGVLIGDGAPEAPRAWADAVSSGFRPGVAALRFFARAITPPGRPRRFDTRFFLAERSAVSAEHPIVDGELDDLGWLTVGEALDRPLPTITKFVLHDIEAWVAGGGQSQVWAVPFYRQVHGRPVRSLLSGAGSSA
ncbi:MAG: NUDIX hydrolase [Hyphomicrobium sp.]|nr:NUDIX hydrolase [Hyphomicrobium sp.]